MARAKAIVAKRIAKAAAKKAGAQEHVDGLPGAYGNGARPGGEAANDPVWLRNEFAEQLRLEDKQTEEVRLVAKELEHLRGRLVASKDAAEGKRAERQVFADLLSTQDAASDEDIRRMLQAINDTAEQLTVQASKEFFTITPRYGMQPVPDNEGPLLADILGTPLYDALHVATAKDTFAGLLLQYAWQACIMSTVSNMLEVFSVASPGIPETTEIDEVFQKTSLVAEETGELFYNRHQLRLNASYP